MVPDDNAQLTPDQQAYYREYASYTPAQQRTQRMSNHLLIGIHDPAFHAMLNRRGYAFLCEGERCEFYAAPGFAVSWTFAFESMLYVAEMLDKIVGQHHCACSCGTPLLRTVAGTGKGEGATHWYEYRSVAAGPDSEPITVCPSCSGNVHETAREIVDE